MYNLQIPKADGVALSIQLNAGETLFVLGANGTGKSSLMHHFYTQFPRQALQISAHRQNWLASSDVNISSQQRHQTETSIQQADSNPFARWKDDYSSVRTSIALFDFVDAENVRARAVTEAFEANNIEYARERALKDAPIRQLNELLRLSNIPIKIVVRAGDQVNAIRDDGPEYGVSELSDGERNALLMAANVLTAKPGALVLIDEPERHLHRSIISPMLSNLFARRRDCAFVVCSHEVALPVDNDESRTLLIRSCSYNGNRASTWVADVLGPRIDVDDDVKRDILGGRRKILFVEGKEQSLDRPLYALLFPGVSIIPKAGCRDVDHAVAGLRSGENLHWLQVFGVIDNDRRSPDSLAKFEQRGVFALRVFSVESLYYHPTVLRMVAERHALVVGGDAESRIRNAKERAIASFRVNANRLSERVAEKSVREKIFRQLPTSRSIADRTPVTIEVDVAAEVAAERNCLDTAIATGEFETLVAQYPIRETSLPTEIAQDLNFASRRQYEDAVRKLALDDAEARNFMRSLFGALEHRLDFA